MCATLGFLLAQQPGARQPVERPFKIVRLDPALDQIIEPNAKLETLGEHFGLTEGPVWIKQSHNGYLLFSDCART
jgi:gluconolactonase